MKNFLKMIKQTTQKIPRKFQVAILVASVLLLALVLVLVITFIRRRGNNETITLTYAHINLSNSSGYAIERRMIQSFMDAHPHIRIEIDQNISIPWTQSLTTAANHNRMPDVFMLEDIGLKAANGWLLDITSHVWTDIDFVSDLSGVVQEAMRIGSIMYAVPFGQNIHGYFVNRDLLRDMGINPPSFGVSANQFLDIVRAATDLSRPAIGLNHAFSFAEWLPAALNPSLGFFAFNGMEFALNSHEMLESISIAAELHNGGYALEGLQGTGNFPTGNALEAFKNGQMAFFYAGTWLADVMIGQLEFDWGFISIPGGRPIVTLETIGIYSNTSHPYEAYLFARWMGHSTEGNLRRLQYASEIGITPNILPVTQNAEVLEALLQINPIPELSEIYASLGRALIDGQGILPGYTQARFTAPTGVEVYGSQHTNIDVDRLIRYSIEGRVYFPDHSHIAEEVARHQLKSALAQFR